MSLLRSIIWTVSDKNSQNKTDIDCRQFSNLMWCYLTAHSEDKEAPSLSDEWVLPFLLPPCASVSPQTRETAPVPVNCPPPSSFHPPLLPILTHPPYVFSNKHYILIAPMAVPCAAWLFVNTVVWLNACVYSVLVRLSCWRYNRQFEQVMINRWIRSAQRS